MSRKIGRVLSIDIIQHAGAHSRGRIRHNGRRYTLFGAFSGVQSCCADRARSERYYGCPSGTHYGSSALPRPWGVPGPKIWRNIAFLGTIQNCTPGVTQKKTPRGMSHFFWPFDVLHQGCNFELCQKKRYFARSLARAPPTA